jgi:hypothetical protein
MAQTNMFGVCGRMTTQPGRRDEVVDLIREGVRAGGEPAGVALAAFSARRLVASHWRTSTSNLGERYLHGRRRLYPGKGEEPPGRRLKRLGHGRACRVRAGVAPASVAAGRPLDRSPFGIKGLFLPNGAGFTTGTAGMPRPVIGTPEHPVRVGQRTASTAALPARRPARRRCAVPAGRPSRLRNS